MRNIYPFRNLFPTSAPRPWVHPFGSFLSLFLNFLFVFFTKTWLLQRGKCCGRPLCGPLPLVVAFVLQVFFYFCLVCFCDFCSLNIKDNIIAYICLGASNSKLKHFSSIKKIHFGLCLIYLFLFIDVGFNLYFNIQFNCGSNILVLLFIFSVVQIPFQLSHPFQLVWINSDFVIDYYSFVLSQVYIFKRSFLNRKTPTEIPIPALFSSTII